MIAVQTTRLTFDLETRALPEYQLLARFNPEFRAKGNLTDPLKIRADVLAKRQDWLDESTLHAERSQILALGYTLDGGETIEQWTFRTFDAMEDWQSGNRRDPFISLDTLARALGIPGKSGDWREFVKLYATDREKALDYVRGDVRCTARVIGAMRG